MILMKVCLLLPLCLLIAQCSPDPPVGIQGRPVSQPAPVVKRSGGVQHIINVSAYDPKKKSRPGRGFSQYDLSALPANGARGLIARAGKGGKLDEKCANFIRSADRAGLLAGLYYRVQRHVSPTRQADQFVARAKAIARHRPANAAPLLLCGDYDGDLSLSAIVRFMDRVEAKTGIVPIAYLENSQALKLKTRAADSRTAAKLRRAPYWLALYSHESGAGPIFPAPGNPRGLVKQYALWPDWTMWQYGGVTWENRRSNAKVYNHGRYRFSKYFGGMDRPMERNIFRGSYANLVSFWSRHGIK